MAVRTPPFGTVTNSDRVRPIAERGAVRDTYPPFGVSYAQASGRGAFVEHFGAIGDGASHPLSERFPTLEAARSVYPHAGSLADETDWAAIQGAIIAIGTARLGRKRSYRINRQILITADAAAILGDGSAVLLPDMEGTFTNTDRRNKYGENACVIEVRGELTEDWRPVDGVTLAGFRLHGGRVDPRMTKVVNVRNATRLRIGGLVIDGFSVGHGIALQSVRDAIVRGCVVEDWYSAHDWGDGARGKVNAQSTGISIDDDRYGSVSERILVEGCAVRRLRKGARLIVELDEQSDGVQIGYQLTRDIVVRGCRFEEIDEGVDASGRHCVIEDNVMSDLTGVGVKLIGGPCWNVVRNNVIRRFYWSGIYVGVNSGHDVIGNLVVGNHVSEPDPHARGCVDIGDPDPLRRPDAGICRDNVFRNNLLDARGSRFAVVRSELFRGTNVFERNIIAGPGVRGELMTPSSAPPGLVVIRDPMPEGAFRVGLARSRSVATAARIAWDRVEVDPREEFDREEGAWVCAVPGIHRIRAVLRPAAIPSAGAFSMRIRLDGEEIAGKDRYAVEALPTPLEADVETFVGFEQRIDVIVFGALGEQPVVLDPDGTVLEIERV